ncbi:MAG: VWA domain-containing protein [Planctomycetota bacterium]|nr:VWA domain-containing protein [Planctomycetota bacterium]
MKHAALLFLLLLSSAVRAKEPAILSRDATLGLVRYYKEAGHWALRGIILLALGPRWHPDGAEIVRQAFTSRDVRLRCYGLEALRRTSDAGLAQVMTVPLIDELVKSHVSTSGKKKYFGEQVRAVLGRVLPESPGKSIKELRAWWEERRETYEPVAWVPVPKKKSRKTVAQPFIRRAFDLQKAGLDLAIVIDSTGSMQRTINLARDALDEIVTILRGVAPRFRVGLVHYRDLEDMKNGAQILVKLTSNHKSVKSMLARMKAEGGGDLPERVEVGLEYAYNKRMGWLRNANKVVILIGDAPPHPSAISKAIRLADAAYNNPFGLGAKRPTTPRQGARAVRPFVTSAISVGTMADVTFKRIAKAGGGAFVKLSGRSRGTDVIVRRVLTLSFGARWSKDITTFLLVYRKYRNRGVYRG